LAPQLAQSRLVPSSGLATVLDPRAVPIWIASLG
jgi:hypothetical protein